MVRRWAILQRPLSYKMETNVLIIMVAAKLHNFCVEQRDDIAPPPCNDLDEGADRLGRTAAEMDTGDTSGVRPSRAPQHARRDTLRDRLQARGLTWRPRGDARRRS